MPEPTTSETSIQKDLLKVLKVDAIVLFGAALLALLVALLSGEGELYLVVMIYLPIVGLVVNLAGALAFGITRRWGLCLGAGVGGVLFFLIGFGLCLGGAGVINALGGEAFSFH